MTQPPLVSVSRGPIVESVHYGDVVVARPDGTTMTVVGDADRLVYPRSALKPFQALAVLGILEDAGRQVPDDHLAIICASHDGGDDRQVAAAAVLAEADMDETALRCPPAWPLDDDVIGQLTAKTTLSHNCSGKHAGMVWAHTVGGGDPSSYLDLGTPLQQRIARELDAVFGRPPSGPGIDGCGAPAWITSIGGLAIGFSRLVAGATEPLMRIRDAMTAWPELVGGPTLPDTHLMQADLRVVAKRGADGVMGCGFLHPDHGPLGIAVKIHDGGDRAAGPALAAILDALGGIVPSVVRCPPVLGGGEPHGQIIASDTLANRLALALEGHAGPLEKK